MVKKKTNYRTQKKKNLMRNKGYQKQLIKDIHEGWVHFFSNRPKCDWSWEFCEYMAKEEKKNGRQ